MIGWGHTLSGLGSRQSGTRYRSSGSGPGSGPEFYPVPVPVTDHPNQRPEGRDLGPGNVSHVCTFAQAVGRFSLLHLGQHAVRPLPSIHLCRDAVPTLPEAEPQPPRMDAMSSHPYLNKKGVLADALFNPAILDTLYSSPRAHWQASQVPPLRMASMEHAFFSSAVYSFFSALGAFSTVAFSMLEAPRVRR